MASSRSQHDSISFSSHLPYMFLFFPLAYPVIFIIFSVFVLHGFIIKIQKHRQRRLLPEKSRKKHKPPTVSSTIEKRIIAKNQLQRCEICFKRYEEEEEVTILDCKHDYHSACITQWFAQQKSHKKYSCQNLCQNSCMLCYQDVNDTPLPYIVKDPDNYIIKVLKYFRDILTREKRIIAKIWLQQCCSICYQEYEKEHAVTILDCKHDYHSACIAWWFALQKSRQKSHRCSCAICRQDVGDVPLPYIVKGTGIFVMIKVLKFCRREVRFLKIVFILLCFLLYFPESLVICY